MRRFGFTLLELLIVLVILSVVLSVSFPKIVQINLSSEESTINRVKSLFSNCFSLSSPVEVCVNFKKNVLSVGGEEVKLPFTAETVVFPGKLISSEGVSKFCFQVKNLNYGAIIGKKENEYGAIFFTLPLGEIKIYHLSSSEEETLKDKIEKGRIVQWFNYYL